MIFKITVVVFALFVLINCKFLHSSMVISMKTNKKKSSEILISSENELSEYKNEFTNFKNEIVEYQNEIPCNIISIYYDGGPIFNEGADFIVPLHWHNDIEINICFDESLVTTVNGHILESEKDSFLIINSGSIHGNTFSKYPLIEGKPRFLGVCIRISDSIFRKVLPNFDVLQFKNIWHPETSRPKEIALELSKYGYPDSKLGKYENIKITSLVYELVYYMCRENMVIKEDVSSEAEIRNMESMRKVMAYIENNYRNPIDETTLAEKFGFSSTYFSKVFKKYINISYKEFLTKTRLSAAKKALLETDRCVTDIAMDCGFSDVRGLINAFKKYENTTPVKYRKPIKGTSTI